MLTPTLLQINQLESWKAYALSVTTEAELIAATKAVKESKWLKGILNELWLDQKTV